MKKNFGGVAYFGQVVEAFEGAEGGAAETLYSVLYDDGDAEDYDEGELIRILDD